jgi:hypothetical protein
MSSTGPYVAEKAPFAGQRVDPADLVRTCFLKLITDPMFEALPLIFLAVYVQLKVEVPTFSLIVALGPNTVTGLPRASLIVVRAGTLTVRLSTLTPLNVILQPAKVCAASDVTAVPGRPGFAVTLVVNVDLVHLTLLVVPGCVNVTTVRAFRPACRTACALTLGPPALPVVSTPCVAANAVAAEDKTSIAVAARSRGLRIWMHLFLEGIPAVRADPPGY